MRLFKVLAALCCAFLVIAALQVKTANADQFNKKTIFTFSAPIEIPGSSGPMVLPAGTYVFKLLDSLSNRHIVQVFNKDENHVYATILAIPNYRLEPTETRSSSLRRVPRAHRPPSRHGSTQAIISARNLFIPSPGPSNLPRARVNRCSRCRRKRRRTLASLPVPPRHRRWWPWRKPPSRQSSPLGKRLKWPRL